MVSCTCCQEAWIQRPEEITGYLPAKEKGRKGGEGSQNLVTCKAQHYREIDLVITMWGYWKGLVEAPLPLKYLWSFLQPSRLSQLGGNSSCPVAALVIVPPKPVTNQETLLDYLSSPLSVSFLLLNSLLPILTPDSPSLPSFMVSLFMGSKCLLILFLVVSFPASLLSLTSL